MSLSDIITNGMATVDMTQDILSNPDAFHFYRIDGRVKRKLSQVKKIYPKRREKTNPDKIIHTLLLARTCKNKIHLCQHVSSMRFYVVPVVIANINIPWMDLSLNLMSATIK